MTTDQLKQLAQMLTSEHQEAFECYEISKADDDADGVEYFRGQMVAFQRVMNHLEQQNIATIQDTTP